MGSRRRSCGGVNGICVYYLGPELTIGNPVLLPNVQILRMVTCISCMQNTQSFIYQSIKVSPIHSRKNAECWTYEAL
jgi:hypothetical protein